MYIRRKVFSKIGEKTFSTTEFRTQKEFAEKKDKEEGEKAKKAGKAMAGAGAALLAGSNAVGLKVGMKRAKAVEKIAEKTGTINVGGNGITAPTKYLKFGDQEAANKAAELDKRHAKKVAKVLKRTNKVGAVGAGLAAAGAGTYLYGKHKAKKDEDQKKITDKEFSDGEPEQKEFNSKAQKILRRAFDKSIGKKISGANTLNNQAIGRKALRKLDGSGVNASINEKARVNGASAASDKLSNSADKYARGVKTRSLKDTKVSQEIYDHDHVYKPTSEVIKNAKQIMKKNK